MEKAIRRTTMMLAVILLSAVPVFASGDYSNMSNEELNSVRGTMRNADETERNAFRTEWQQRVQNMTSEERQQYSGHPANASADGSGAQQRKGQGGGGGRRMGK